MHSESQKNAAVMEKHSKDKPMNIKTLRINARVIELIPRTKITMSRGLEAIMYTFIFHSLRSDFAVSYTIDNGRTYLT